MIQKKTMFFAISIVVIATLAGAGGFLAAEHLQQPSSHEEPQKAPHPLSEQEGDGHDHEAEVSDLDRPVEEMWAAFCEHGILQHQCDECRYEIGTVKLAPSILGDNGLVRTGLPEKRQEYQQEHRLSGEVQFDDTRTVRVASPVSGLITRRFVTPGTQVVAGAPLFEIDSPEVTEAKGSYLKAKAALSLASQSTAREARLFAQKIAAEVEVQEAKAKLAEAEAEIAASRGRLVRLGLSKTDVEAISAGNGSAALNGLVVIRAPRKGTVIEGNAASGEQAEAGKELLTLSDLETVWVMADVKEADLTVLANGSGKKAVIEAMGHSFTGRLDAMAGRLSETTRTAKARFSVSNADGLLKPGMFVSVRLFLPAQGEVLVVPKVAVLADAGRTFVFTHKEGDYWIRRPVVLGARLDGMVEIASGIAAEQRIITDGSFLLKSDVLRGKMGAGCAD
ncbi:MAG: efflux RND transporter periplasmic adaptor subunit [Desulfobulbus sp.]